MDNETREMIERQAMTIRIIVGALCMGVVSFATVVLFIRHGNPPAPGFMTYLSIGIACINTIAAIIVPRLIVNSQRRSIAAGEWRLQGSNDSITNLPQQFSLPDTDGAKLAIVFQTKTIIGCAILEGAAFFLLVAYMLEGHFSVLIVAAVMLFVTASHFPLPGQVANWVEGQLRVLNDEKQLRG